MCSFVIRETNISEVVIGRPIIGIGGATSRLPILTDPNVPDWRPPPVIRWMDDAGGEERE
jgi:hypothetical protein